MYSTVWIEIVMLGFTDNTPKHDWKS